MEATLNNITLEVITGDITALTVDAFVYAARPDLDMGGSGLGQKYLQKAGESVQAECRAIRFCDVGEVIITSAGNLPGRYLIHAVTPRMGEGGERGKLASAIWNSLRLAVKHEVTSIAFPALAIGRHGGYPAEGCARVMAQKIVDFTFEDVGKLSKIVVCLYKPEIHAIFDEAFRSEVDAAKEP